MTPLIWGILGLFAFFTVVTVGSLYLYTKRRKHRAK